MTEHTVSFRKSKKSFRVAHDSNLLGTLEMSGEFSIPALCRGGSCGTCKVRVSKGRAELESVKALSRREQAKGWILACSARVVGDLELDL